MGETGIRQPTTLSDETPSCGQSLHRKLFNDCCLIHGEFTECDENGKRICQCKKKGLIVAGEYGACRLTGEYDTAVQPHQDARSFDAQPVTKASSAEMLQDQEKMPSGNAESLGTRNTVGTSDSGTMHSASRQETGKCTDIHHETCALAKDGFCNHPHHDNCIEGGKNIAPLTRGGTDDGTASRAAEVESAVSISQNMQHDAVDENLSQGGDKNSSQVGIKNTPVPPVGSSNSLNRASIRTDASFAAADKSVYQTSTVTPRETIAKSFRPTDASQFSRVDSTATKDRQMTSDMGPKQASTVDAFEASQGGRQTEKGMRDSPLNLYLITCSLVRHVNWA